MRAATLLLPALLLAGPAQAQVDAQKTLQVASIELQRAFPKSGNPADVFARLNAFEFSEPTRAGLQAIFGDPRPFRIEPVTAPRGRRAFAFTVRPADYRAANGTHVLSTPVVGRIDVTHGGRSIATRAELAALDLEGNGARAQLRGMRVDATRVRGPYDLWFGTNRYTLASLNALIGKTPLTLSGAHVDGSTLRRGAFAEIRADFDFGDLRIGGEQAGLRSRFTLSGLPLKALASVQEKMLHLSAKPAAEEARGLLSDAVSAMGSARFTLRIDQLELRYKDTRASLRGALQFDYQPGMEHVAPNQIWQHAQGEFELRVPLAFVRAATGAIATQVAGHGAGAAPPTDAVDAIVARITSGGYGRIENEVIVVKLELRDGALYAGGKKLDLGPNPQRIPDQPVRAMMPSLPPRRIPERCPLPPFPGADTPEDQHMTRLRILIAADGRTTEAELLQASTAPAYDQSVLAAAKECRWIPAIVDGQPGPLDAAFGVERDAAGEPQLRLLGARR